jgi:hypothetical protein
MIKALEHKFNCNQYDLYEYYDKSKEINTEFIITDDYYPVFICYFLNVVSVTDNMINCH